MANSAAELQQRLAGILDAHGFQSGADIDERYKCDWEGSRLGEPLAVIRPQSPEVVPAVMRVLNELKQPVLVQGGRTGVVHGSIPADGEVVLSLERLNHIEHLDEESGTALVQAGVPLQTLQEAATRHGWFFPVDIGARGSALIGGNIATNAGGNRVLRYGMMRNSVIGLEAVLADGTVISRMNGLLKDNVGYDLKQMFIGSEGTLGVVTRAILQLQPPAKSSHTALIALAQFDDVLRLLKTCRQSFGPSLTSFEVMWDNYFNFVTQKLKVGQSPFQGNHRFFVLVEVMSFGTRPMAEELENTIFEFSEALGTCDAVVAQSLREATEFWAIRDATGEASMAIAPYAHYDVSLPHAKMERWVDEIVDAWRKRGASEIQVLGHVGDCNLHLVAGWPGIDDPDMSRDVTDIIHNSVAAINGSISAEHGIGLDKKLHFPQNRSEADVELMRQLKKTLDPNWILNRGRIFDPPS